MPLSWNEIRARAHHFVADWRGTKKERAESQSFWNAFFGVFGINRREVAVFERAVQRLKARPGYIDLFWPGVLLVEHKSAGLFADAEPQIQQYLENLPPRELPKYLIACDFETFELTELESGESQRFALEELPNRIDLFGFIAGYEPRKFRAENPVDRQAAELMGDICDTLHGEGYRGELEKFLTQLLFCFFADDTSIFPERGMLGRYLRERTSEDGTDLGMRLAHLFRILDTPPSERMTSIDEQVARFPYINGSLFEGDPKVADFKSATRAILLRASSFDWSQISPAIFGSLFQTVMDSKKRRAMGAHYTSEKSILKTIEPLFLDELRAEFEAAKRHPEALRAFHDKIANLRFFDPACGCGNFLIVAYREMRLLELDVLCALYPAQETRDIPIERLCRIDVDHFYGIEVERFPARIATAAMWLTDHQMNRKVSVEMGEYFARIPLAKSPHIFEENALRRDWREVLPPDDNVFVFGNPPFVGRQYRTADQRADMELVFGKKSPGTQNLDYVCAWHLKAAKFIRGTAARAAFVSTNSISQGEQAGVLWPRLFAEGMKIRFAHRTFNWSNEARGKAHVHVVVVGYGAEDAATKTIFEYGDINGEPRATKAQNINPYFVDAENIAIENRAESISESAPKIVKGSMPNDGGHLLLDSEEKDALLRDEPEAEKFLRRFVGSKEFINKIERWCLWLVDAKPEEIRRLPLVKKRIEGVRANRAASKKALTREFAARPTIFAEIRQPKSSYLLIPEVSSEARNYIPMAFMPPEVILSNKGYAISNAGFYDFGVLSSQIHMTWMRQVAGRLKSDYSYSAKLVYNNFPWPNPTAKQKAKIEKFAQAVMSARSKSRTSSLADLYDPNTMPSILLRAHRSLDRAVDRAYRAKKFESDQERVSHLFALHRRIIEPAIAAAQAKKPRAARKSRAARPQ